MTIKQMVRRIDNTPTKPVNPAKPTNSNELSAVSFVLYFFILLAIVVAIIFLVLLFRQYLKINSIGNKTLKADRIDNDKYLYSRRSISI